MNSVMIFELSGTKIQIFQNEEEHIFHIEWLGLESVMPRKSSLKIALTMEFAQQNPTQT